MRFKSILFVLLVAIGLLATVLYGSNRVSAVQSQIEYVSFGMVGVAGGQTLRLNVVNAVVQSRRLPPGPCLVTLTLVDGTGAVIAQSTETLAPGQAAALDVRGDDLTGRVNNRAQVRAYIQVVDDSPGNRLPPGPCVATLEVFDNLTGKTELLHPGTMLEQRVAAD